MFDDTGKNVPETQATLLLQRKQLEQGKRLAQMFPKGTKELPKGKFDRVVTERGVFHFDPRYVSADKIVYLSARHRENEVLGLGPYNKSDVMRLVEKGETPLCISEVSPTGVEIRTAIGTASTLMLQQLVFENTKFPDSMICISMWPEAIERRMVGESHGSW